MQITVDDQLFEQAARLANTKEPSQLASLVFGEYIQHHQTQPKRDLRDLIGKVSIDPDYDYKKLRIGE